jgi:DNA adenine methylase
MQYLGGKARVGKRLVEYLESVRKPGQEFIEPFCGGLWVTHLVPGDRVASDANKALITLYQEMQNGWLPPAAVSEETYRAYKAKSDDSDPMTAFIGFGCSFAGKWFGGYARSGQRNYAMNARNSLLKKFRSCADVRFVHADYWDAIQAAPKGSMLYLDPPYANTTGYGETGSFDSGVFWSVVRKVSLEHDVYISEYSAPPDFRCVLELPTKTDMRAGGIKEARVERLFKYGS